MSAFAFGLVAGVLFGALSVGLMLPLSFPDKTTALLGAFVDRFAIGFLVPLVSMPGPAWVRGLLVGLLVSLPSAILTKSYAPILILGAMGGWIIGWLALRFVA
ncbi:MAG TPA: hypothetical protein VGS22_24830 [Thermoanaerobaculia bacterium]|jgi:hypothetical protein|nr:hypothetical protein [Thermoanaerobaculia bacterium]